MAGRAKKAVLDVSYVSTKTYESFNTQNKRRNTLTTRSFENRKKLDVYKLRKYKL